MKKSIVFVIPFLLAACNTVNIKPHSLDKNQLFYAERGGYTMKLAVKQELEKRGYKIVVGKNKTSSANGGSEFEFNDNMNAKYIVKVQEQSSSFSPVICMFGGFYWWKFNVSIADQKTGEELLAWAGKGCANSSLRKLNRLMNELEQK